jgi:hypothetical protein
MTLNKLAILIPVTAALYAAVFDQPARSVSLTSPGQSSLVHFQNGYFVSFDRPTATVSLFDRDGRRLPDLTLNSVPGITRVTIRNVALSPDGAVVVAASCYSAEAQVVSALIWADLSGKITKVVRTSPYAALSLAFASDGTLWTAGREHGANKSSLPGHHIVRQFDSTGKMLQSLLPVESFPTPKGVYHPADLVEMTPLRGGGIGMWIPASSEWIEISRSGAYSRMKLPVDDDGSEIVTGVALAEDGNLVLSVQPVSGKRLARLIRYRRSTKTADVLQECDIVSCVWAHIAGGDHGSLVMEGAHGNFGWFAPPVFALNTSSKQ